MVEMKQSTRISGFKQDLCNLCGICLHECPVLRLPLNKAKKEFSNLINGEESKYAFQFMINKYNHSYKR